MTEQHASFVQYIKHVTVYLLYHCYFIITFINIEIHTVQIFYLKLYYSIFAILTTDVISILT